MTHFPVGFFEFHKDEGLNFQLNRFYSSGFLGYEELMDIGKQIKDFDTWIDLFLKLAAKAEAEGNIGKSAVCYRAAQFYTLGDQRDANGQLLKAALYEKCFEAFAKIYCDEKAMKYDRIAYQSGYLPVYSLRRSDPSKGTIVIHGGYDSFVQEFLQYAIYLYEAGYDIYFFEGPGQGEVLYRCNLKMTPEWEHCVRAVLDFYRLNDVTLIGISLGGYLATRAAAFEPRIKRLVMFDLIYDFYGSLKARLGKIAGKFLDYLTEHPDNILWNAVEWRMNQVYFLKWLFEQGYFIFEDVHTPCAYFNCIKQYNTKSLSAKIRQDTLVLAGASDLYTVFLKEQVDALVNAKSVESRLFTKEEHADQHCQVGNTKLVLDVIIEWIERKQQN